MKKFTKILRIRSVFIIGLLGFLTVSLGLHPVEYAVKTLTALSGTEALFTGMVALALLAGIMLVLWTLFTLKTKF
ncbi:MAG: hypothetical protein WCT49_05535 [Candidatus Paceibacterota bacterium]|jgi:hypothetical protein